MEDREYRVYSNGGYAVFEVDHEFCTFYRVTYGDMILSEFPTLDEAKTTVDLYVECDSALNEGTIISRDFHEKYGRFGVYQGTVFTRGAKRLRFWVETELARVSDFFEKIHEATATASFLADCEEANQTKVWH